jgi:hypothetical protein
MKAVSSDTCGSEPIQLAWRTVAAPAYRKADIEYDDTNFRLKVFVSGSTSH